MAVCVSIYSYIEGDQGLQEEFVMLLDTLCHSGGLARSGHGEVVT